MPFALAQLPKVSTLTPRETFYRATRHGFAFVPALLTARHFEALGRARFSRTCKEYNLMKKILILLIASLLASNAYAAVASGPDVTTRPDSYYSTNADAVDSVALLPPPPAFDSIEFSLLTGQSTRKACLSGTRSGASWRSLTHSPARSRNPSLLFLASRSMPQTPRNSIP